MSKKIFAVIFCFITLVTESYAQKNISTFSNLSAGIEIGTTGLGLEIATPLSSHFIVRGGLSILPYNYNYKFNVNVTQSILDRIDEAVVDNPDVVPILQQHGLPTKAEDISRDISANAILKMINGQLLFNYYPWAKGAFHLTAGVYFGSGNVIDVKGKMDEAAKVLDVLKDYADVDLFNESYIVDESKGYQLSGKDITGVHGYLKVNPVKPYFGFGFGRAIPNGRIGVNMDIGAYYQGTPSITCDSKNIQKMIDDELNNFSSVLKHTAFYPVLSFQLYVKIF